VALVLGPGAGDGVTKAARAAAARAGVELERGPVAERNAWWAAGLTEAVDRDPAAPSGGPARYDVARSPRNTRGATRA
jgi:hypothetical protein